jgi:hypothetical protein
LNLQRIGPKRLVKAGLARQDVHIHRFGVSWTALRVHGAIEPF